MLKIANIAIVVFQSGFGQFGLSMLASAIFNGRGDAPLNHSRLSGLIHLVVFMVINPVALALAALLFARIGGGLIPLPTHSGWIVAGFLTYLLAYDLAVYIFHRIEHMVPFLWALHSMHHADTRVTVMTAHVNYWAAMLIETAFVYPVVLVIFKVPVMFVLVGAWVRYLSTIFVHAETRLHLGPIGYLIVGPQYHRIHHSSDPELFGKNFTGMFPVWDWLFGTLVIPGRDQFPATGLGPSDVSADSFLTLFWPWRKRLARQQFG